MSQAKWTTGSAQPSIFPFDLLETLLKTVIALGDISTTIRLSSTCSDLRVASEKYLLRSLFFNSSWFPQDNLPILIPCGCTLDGHGDPEKQVTKPKDPFTGFSHLLDRNPRLARSIKHLSLCLSKAHLADIHVVRVLRRLRNVESLTWTAFQEGRAPCLWEDVPDLVQDALVGILEGVSRLRVGGGVWGISPRLLSPCRRLVDLELEDCTFHGATLSATPSEKAATPPSESGSIKLQSLNIDFFTLAALQKLTKTEPSTNWPILDFSELTTLRLNTSGPHDEFLPVLLKKMNSITQLVHLECQCYSTRGPNLNILLAAFHPGSFRTLRSIKYTVGITGDGNPFLGLIDALLRFPLDNDLQTLAIYITVTGMCSMSQEYWGRFNEILTETQFPSLRSVYVKLAMQYETDPVDGLEERFYVLADESFRRIKERLGVAFVFDLRYDEYLY